jgi:hypothetical protein
MVRGYVSQYCRERADSQMIVVGDSEVMLLRLFAGQPDMAAGLPGDAIAQYR